MTAVYLFERSFIRQTDIPTREYARALKKSSGSGVEFKQAAEAVATGNGPAVGILSVCREKEEEKVALTSVVPPK